MSDERRVGVVGLGLMGTAITERLLDDGYDAVVWNRTPEKAVALIERGAVWSDNPLTECRRVILSLYSSAVVRDVMEQLKAGWRPGQIVIDTTTGEPDDAAAMAERLASFGVTYLDAPISGSSQQTREGEATVMVGGDRASFEACRDLWPVLGKKVFHVGVCGAASKMKLVTNLVLGLNRAALAEGLAFAAAVGISPGAALEVLQESAAYSKTMETKGRKMVDGDFRAQARLSQHLKDVRIILETAAESGRRLPLTEAHAELLHTAERMGLGESDNSAIIRVYQQD
jgi:3-hydroxyisobutyrate dehydrogenase-like beta-hydroxyacid dehydrogenase